MSQYAAVIPNFITALLAGEPPTIFGDGEQSRDFTYVRQRRRGEPAAPWTPRASRARRSTSPAASGRRLNQLLDELARARSAPTSRPTTRRPGPATCCHSWADCSRAQEAFGYRPEIGLREGLRRTIEYYEAEGVPATEIAPAR